MTLLTERYNYKPINRNEEQGKRFYLCPDGSKVPSVTTILSATQPIDKIESLNKWRNSVGATKAKEITAESAGRGTRLHKYLEDYILNGELSISGSNPYSHQSHTMAETIIQNGFKNINEIWGSEVGLYYPQLYAGTADAIGVHDNDAAVFDYKQSNKFKQREWITDYFLQLSSYIIAHDKIYNTKIKKGVILMCVKPPEISPGKWGKPTYQEFIIEGNELEKYKSLWWDRVDLFYSENN